MTIKLGRDKAVVEPRMWVKDKLPTSKAIIYFSESCKKFIRRNIRFKEKVNFIPSIESHISEYDGQDILFIMPFFGAPAATIALELAISAGVSKVITVGEAGSINKVVRIGDCVIPTWGIREEGVSYHYMPPDYMPKPSSQFLAKIKNTLNNIRLKASFHFGGVWTTDAIFRETLDKIAEYSRVGVLCVDMETTALMSIAEYRGIDLVVILAISDELYDGVWRSGWGSRKLSTAEREAIKIALDMLISI